MKKQELSQTLDIFIMF